MSVRVRRLGAVVLLTCGLGAALVPFSPAFAQEAATGGRGGAAGQAGPGITADPAAIQLRCPGGTPVSATATDLLTSLGAAIAPLGPFDPAAVAQNPCFVAGSGPEIDWSADYVGRRMTLSGTWKDKLRSVLADFDALHALYVANPQIKDMGLWPARMQETFELAAALTDQSGREDARYYARALQDEYKAGIYDDHPLLLRYALQARERLGELAAPPAPVAPARPRPAR